MKITRDFVAFITLITILAPTTVAASPENEGDWNQWKDCNWTPTFTSEQANGFSDCAHLRTDFYFDQTSYDALIDSGYYFTVEHQANEDHPVSVTEMYSFLPNPTFDTDDDGLFEGIFADGYYEEAEVTCTTPEDIVVGKNYYFATWWDKPETLTTSAFNYLVQLSNYSNLMKEYNEKCSDYINSIGWTYPPTTSMRALSMSDTDISQITNRDTIEDKYTVLVTDIDTLEDLENYKNNTTSQYLSILADKANTANLCSENIQAEYANAVITFNTPVSMEYLTSLLNENSTLESYEAKLTNANDEWITMWSKRLNEQKLMEIAEKLSGTEDLTFCGVTSATIRIPVNDSTYASLCEDDNIYLVDMSDYIIKTQHNDFSLDVVVSDCYYYLETRGNG